MSPNDLLDTFRHWFESQGWTPWPFQEDAWRANLAGESGLIHVPTGAGKTYAAYLGPLARMAADPRPGLRLLYISPLRAMARDIQAALERPIEELGLEVTVGSRTGDTSSSERRRQKKQMPNVLVTTPESVSLLLSYANAQSMFSKVETIVVDEWHELMGSKRGTQYELAASRVRKWAPEASTWALSATIANLEEAARTAAGSRTTPRLITADIERPTKIDVIHPDEIDSFPWYGHMGLNMLEQVLDELDPKVSTLFFTNTRNQAESWYQAIHRARPEWEAHMGLHHGSIDLEQRRDIEEGLKSGRITLGVCTSSMDLGVDFAPVERVFQVGSPKGIARVMQRAGRSGHRPGETCRITFVPTHALELFELAALREAFDAGVVEARVAPRAPLDVLAQHMVTCALGGGFTEEELYDEICGATSYAGLSRDEFRWSLDLVEHGGTLLEAYPNYHKVERDEDGVYRVPSKRLARMHRSNIGTITSSSSIRLKFLNGSSPGHVEESFISRLNPGARFIFSGRVLEFIRIHEMQAIVKVAGGKTPDTTPRWMGGHMPLSTQLADSLRSVLDDARNQKFDQPEVVTALPIIERQSALSAVPAGDRLLAETLESRDGHHLFLYPFAGRLVHEGLAALLAYRFGRFERATFSLCVNDYGIEFVCPEPFRYGDALREEHLFSVDNLDEDVLEAINLGELARRQFRKIARVSGLVFEGYPGSRKNSRQMQTSSGLLYDVFRRYDPTNLLLQQAEREVLEIEFEKERLVSTLERMASSGLDVIRIDQPTPLAFPLLVASLRAKVVSTESLLERIERMKSQWTSTN